MTMRIGKATGAASLPTPALGVGKVGVNINGMQYAFGVAPSDADLDYLREKGVGFVRLPVAWEKLQSVLLGPLSSSYVAAIQSVRDRLAQRGIATILDLHNNGRYDPAFNPPGGPYDAHAEPGSTASGVYVLGSASLTQAMFVDLWTRLPSALTGFAAYGLMNEPHDLVSANLINNGNAFTGSGWFTNGGAVLTPNYAADAYGGNTAWLLTAGSGYGGLARQVVFATAGTYTLSAMFKSESGTKSLYFQFNDAGNTTFNATTTWTRKHLTFTVPSPGTYDIGIVLNMASGQVETSNWQVEAGSTATEMGNSSTWQLAAQAAINAIDAIDTTTPILVCGDNYSGARTWTTDNAGLKPTRASGGKVILEAHLYLDATNGGQYTQTYAAQGMTATQGATWAHNFIDWCSSNSYAGFCGETGWPGADANWNTAGSNMIDAFLVAGMPVCLWNYETHQPGDISSWPHDGLSGRSLDPLLFGMNDTDQLRQVLVRAKNVARPYPF